MLTSNASRWQPIGIGDSRHVRQRQPAGWVAADETALEVIALHGHDGTVAAIIEDEDLDWKVQTTKRFQFLNIELKAAVAV